MMLTTHVTAVAGAADQQGGQHQHGIISAVDPVSHTVQVLLQPQGVETGWLPDLTMSAGDLRISCPSGVGTQVLLAPIEGDPEHMAIVGRLFDTVTQPPVSPQTGKPGQPGELLIVTGQGSYGPDPTNRSALGVQPTENAAWFHLLPSGVYLGAGSIKVAITEAGVAITAGEASYTFTPQTLALLGAALTTDQDVTAGDVSLKEHIHINAGGSGLSGVPQQ